MNGLGRGPTFVRPTFVAPNIRIFFTQPLPPIFVNITTSKTSKTLADVFSQIYIQTVFAVKHQQALILPEWEERLYQYTTGIVQTRGHKMLAIGGMPDHIHIFLGLKPAEALSDLVREIKNATNDFIKENHLSPYKFDWQAVEIGQKKMFDFFLPD